MNDEPEKGSPDPSNPTFDLGEAFMLRQDQLMATLGVARKVGGHPVAIGDASELNWRGMLESVTPTRYRVSRGFVVDADGARSEQIDVLIHDRHFSPVLLDVGDYQYVPAEAVYGAIEIKQEISARHVEYAGGKVASVRRLRRTSAPVHHAGGTFDPKEPSPILGGILAMGSVWNPPLGEPLDQALAALDDGQRLDIGCVLDAGSFELMSTGELTKSDPTNALISFVLGLLKRLQAMASPPAIEYDEYGRSLGKDA